MSIMVTCGKKTTIGLGNYVARAERKPVVLSVPLDLQTEEFPYLPDYTPSTDLMPRAQLLRPDPAVVDEIVAMVAEAERPTILESCGRAMLLTSVRPPRSELVANG